jgi:type I restriction-modification system specificity subunit
MSKMFLGDVCLPESSNIAQKDLTDKDGQYPIYGASGLISHVNFYRQECEYIAVVKDGAGIGRVFLLPPYSSVIGTMQYILPKPNIDVHYLYFAMQFMNLAKYYSGSTIPHIYFKNYKYEPIKLPPLEKQREIADTLETIKQTEDNLNEQITHLDELVKSQFVEMFGDPILNTHGWQKVSLSALAEIKIGPFGSLLHREDYIVGGHPVVNPSHVHDGNIVIDEKLTISETKYKELSAYHLFENDVVLGRRGEMGRCAVVQTSGLLCGTGSMIIRTLGEVRADFLQKIISFPSFKKMLEDMAVGQTMPNLNVPIISRLEIIKPPNEVQNAYYAFVEQVDKSKLVLRQLLEKQQTLKAALMQEYFS